MNSERFLSLGYKAECERNGREYSINYGNGKLEDLFGQRGTFERVDLGWSGKIKYEKILYSVKVVYVNHRSFMENSLGKALENGVIYFDKDIMVEWESHKEDNHLVQEIKGILQIEGIEFVNLN